MKTIEEMELELQALKGKSNKGDKHGHAEPQQALQSSDRVQVSPSESNELLDNLMAALTDNGRFFHKAHNGRMCRFVTATGELYVPVPVEVKVVDVPPVKPVQTRSEVDNVIQEPEPATKAAPVKHTDSKSKWDKLNSTGLYRKIGK